MAATSMSRMIVPLLALVAAIGVALLLAIQYARREPADTAETKATTAAPASNAQDRKGSSTLAAVQAEADAVVAALGGASPPKASSDGVPAFDIARIEPTGDSVIAGRASPGATIELLRNGEPHDRTVADESGQFAMIPSRLPAGTYDLTLRATQPDGRQTTSTQSVTVALEQPTDKPVVALMTPGKPSVVLSQPAATTPGAKTVAVEAVEVEADGKFHVSGRASPGAAVRFYLNDSFVTSVTAGADGAFAVTINKGVAPGSYRVRLDAVAAGSDAVLARAEVPFSVPETGVAASVQAAQPKRPDAAVREPQLAAAGSGGVPNQGSASAVVVPKIATTTVNRGDNLWRISRLTYGEGPRYTVIYNANREQIRDPDLIYPGQVFVLPTSEARP